MNVTKTALEGVYIIEPRVFEDNRGWFMETYSKLKLEDHDISVEFVQDNHSKSRKGVLRGLHYQLEPYAQGKLVRCVVGEVFDVAVDIRKSSPTFGKWVGVNLSAENKRQLWIPEGFAHGFVVLSPEAELLYKASGEYAPEADSGILWNDKEINIDWDIDFEPILSEKDKIQPTLNEYKKTI